LRNGFTVEIGLISNLYFIMKYDSNNKKYYTVQYEEKKKK